MAALYPFHLAFAVTDLPATERFFVDVIGCEVGRQAARWIDFNFFGHQISAHLVDETEAVAQNEVDGDQVPTQHFGMVLPWERWHEMVARLNESGQAYLIAPKTRFTGEPGEQATFFLRDPSGNALEFKSFREPQALFDR
ncbi:MAG: glyoxalase [Myxococcales bacterium]|nr:glyoxalase [Myxococcales bacterium]|tara:strand:+ start:2150 stop:2569 length:420 start_codon:yes stop_codon:yes gene_type:complete